MKAKFVKDNLNESVYQNNLKGTYKVYTSDGKFTETCIVKIDGSEVYIVKNWDSSGGEYVNDTEPIWLTTREWMAENNVTKIEKID